MIPLILMLLIVACFAVYTIAPFFQRTFRNKKISPDSNEMANLLVQKEESLAALSDLEYDLKMKKMSEADYLQQKEKLTAEAVEILKKLDSLKEPEIHHAVDAARKRTAKIGS